MYNHMVDNLLMIYLNHNELLVVVVALIDIVVLDN
jgi:hypothetical protein